MELRMPPLPGAAADMIDVSALMSQITSGGASGGAKASSWLDGWCDP